MKRTLLSNRFFSVAFATVILAGPAFADVYFGWGGVAGASALGGYRDFGKQGRFFSTSDYGFVPGEEDQFSAAKLGLKWDKSPPVVRGQNAVAVSQLGEGFYGTPWLSGGGDCIFGLAFDEPLKPRWEKDPEQQFAAFPDKTPRFEQAVIYWGREVPKPGTWGAGLLNAEGKLLRAEVNHEPLYPYDKSTITFPPTTVKKLYFGVKGGEKGDNFVEVRKIALLMHNEPQIKNSVLVDQPDAYSAYYSTAKPGEIEKLTLKSFSFPGQQQHNLFLQSLAPFIEVDGQRLHPEPGDQPAKVTRQGDLETLTYPLDFKLPDGKTAKVEVTTAFGVDPKTAIKFALKGSGLPKGARVGLEMKGEARYFQNLVDDGATVESATGIIVSTPAGPVALSWKGNGKLSATRTTETVNIDVRSAGENLDVTLGLPIGAEAGVQPSMINYTTRPSLADQGDPGVAPFTSDDLELLETINVGDPNDPYTVYDITNDPLVAKWRQSGEAKLPRKFGSLEFINEPEKAKVPITKIANQPCRDLGPNETTYFRVNMKTHFAPQVPYLVVVEHAFDKERRGEFHSIAVNGDGTDWRQDDSLWHSPCPFGGFDTGKGPYPGGFRNESVLVMRPIKNVWAPETTISLVFSNTRVSSFFKNFEKNPDGLAIKRISIYRVKQIPQLPDLQPLLPKEPRRHVTMDAENFSPWFLTEAPRIYGFDGLWTHRQPAAQFLYGGGYDISRPSWGNWVHPNSFQANRALYEKAAREGVNVKTTLGWLLDLGFEGTDRGSFLGFGWLPGPIWGSIPLSPTSEELKHLGSALDRSLAALAKYPSLSDIAVGDLPVFSRRNLEDFSKQTGVAFKAGPLPEDNLKRLLESPQPTVEAWSQWSSQKRFEFLSWVLKKARAYRPEITLSLNQTWYCNGTQGMYYGNQWPFDPAGLPNAGIKTYGDFLKFVGIDPALYSKDNGFVFGVDMEPPFLLPGRGCWPFEGSADAIRDGFGGGLSVSLNNWDESPKSLQAWGCNYIKDQNGFRKGIIDALLQANAREYILQSYYYDCARGRLADLRELAVPFRLLPFAKPEPFAGKLEDSAKQAVIHKYGDRYGLVNPGDKPTDVTLTLPEGAATVADLSNGIRQPLAVSGDRTVKLRMKPWSLKTLEIKKAQESK